MGWVTLTLRKTELKRTHADYQMEDLRISREKRQRAREYHYQQTLVRNEQAKALNNTSTKTPYEEAKNAYFNFNTEYQEALKEAQQQAAVDSFNGSNDLNQIASYFLNNRDYLEQLNQEASANNTDLFPGAQYDYDAIVAQIEKYESGNETPVTSFDYEKTFTFDDIKDWANDQGKTKDQVYQDYLEEKENYEAEQNQIKEEFESQLEDIEEDANDTETMLDQEQVEIEAQMEAISQEMQAVTEAVSQQIQGSTIKLA